MDDKLLTSLLQSLVYNDNIVIGMLTSDQEMPEVELQLIPASTFFRDYSEGKYTLNKEHSYFSSLGNREYVRSVTAHIVMDKHE